MLASNESWTSQAPCSLPELTSQDSTLMRPWVHKLMPGHCHGILNNGKAILQLERQHNTRIVLPSDAQSSPDWDLYFKDGKSGIRARQDIMNLIAAHPPQKFKHVEMDPFFHEHIHRHGARELRDDHGVHLLIPSVAEPTQHVVLVYEGPSSAGEQYQVPNQRPTPQEMIEFQQNLERAEKHLLSLIAGQEAIGSTDIDVPSK